MERTLPIGLATAYGQLLKQSYTFELPDKTSRTVRFEKDRHNRIREINSGEDELKRRDGLFAGLRRMETSPQTSPHLAPKGLQIVFCAPAKSLKTRVHT